MKIRHLRVLAAIGLVSCGGGGGGAATPIYSGSWSGGVSLVSNTCPRQIPEEFLFLSILHNVDQALQEDTSGNRSLEVVLSDGVETFVGLGELDTNGEGHSFSVTGAPHELPGFVAGSVCIETIDFQYDSIDFETGTAGFISRHSSIKCTRASAVTTCDVVYTGSAFRTANPVNG